MSYNLPPGCTPADDIQALAKSQKLIAARTSLVRVMTLAVESDWDAEQLRALRAAINAIESYITELEKE